MDEVGCYQLGDEGGEDVCEEDDGLGDVGADEIEGCGEDDNVEDIVYEACEVRGVSWASGGGRGETLGEEGVPKSQNAIKTLVSAPWKTALNLALYTAQDEAGDPGRGSNPEEEGDDLFIVSS